MDLKLNYLSPVTDETLVATGRCLRAGGTLSYAEARVTDANGRLMAHGASTLLIMRGKGLDIPAPKFLDG